MSEWKIVFCVALFMTLAGARARAESHELKSPDGRIGVRIETDKQIRYSVSLDGRLLTGPNPLSMTLGDGKVLGRNARLEKADRESVKDKIIPPVRIKNAVIEDVYNELTLTFAGSYFVVFRAYDDGLAYRFGTSAAGPVTVVTEDIQYRFGQDHNVYFPDEASFHSHQERLYQYVPLSSLGPEKFCSIPMLVEAGGGVKIAISESDLFDYPGFYLSGQADSALKAVFPAVAIKEERTSDRNVKVVERAGHISETAGPRRFPWRVMVVAGTDADLVTSEIIYRLGAPCRLEDTSWIKPGKVAWDWYNANNLFGVDFRAGVNTETYKF
ncbi:MAG: glycoside hydrolase family 97 N-terminal domain-containing protein, partial [Candidatus Aminicenantes bacterium]